MGRYTNPRDIYFGEGSRHEVKNLKGKKAFVVSGGHSMRRGGFLQELQKDLEDAGFEVKLFEGVTSDPSVDVVMEGAKAMQEFQPDWIVESAVAPRLTLQRLCGSSTSILMRSSTTFFSRSASLSSATRLTSVQSPLRPAPALR